MRNYKDLSVWDKRMLEAHKYDGLVCQTDEVMRMLSALATRLKDGMARTVFALEARG